MGIRFLEPLAFRRINLVLRKVAFVDTLMFLEVALRREAAATASVVTLEWSFMGVNTSLVNDKVGFALVRLSTTRYITSVFVHIHVDLLVLFQMPGSLK